MSNFVLTQDNYYTADADRAFMSCSQYQAFRECEAKALAKIDKRWTDEDCEAFLVGNYFHSYFEGPEAHEKFCQEHADAIYKTKKDKLGNMVINGKYAPYEKADKMIKVAEGDEIMKNFIDMPGDNEIFMTGTVWGIPWKVKLDKYIRDKRIIIDYKTCANIQEMKYNPITKTRETFVETYGYVMRAAIYCEIERQFSGAETDAKFILICISKQDYPDKEILLVNHRARFDYELEQIKQNIVRIVRIKNHEVLPHRCGLCDYCRATKKIKSIIPYYKLDPEFKDTREEDYAFSIDDMETVPEA